ncbi:Cytidine deaminase [Roseovarius litorisediminis]|uniref:Cytidine deaminase n=1 Tax=Roseovarius litorisediminis TaxID=1312363 RepID=A0A1Y5SPH0_9RHOB|nr:cytidine deaminase [Roseovarius litorisediminis]SLN45022.1 Cytidine deaminase [Roseovarius litorisediminis]
MKQNDNALLELVAECLTAAPGQAAMVPAEKILGWIEQTGGTKQEFMVGCLPLAQAYSRPAISGFPVGAVAMGMPVDGMPFALGNVYFGASFEFRHQSLTLVVHGEQSAINNALLQGEHGAQYVAITAPPCGYCRQFMYEVTTATHGLTIILAKDGTYTETLLTGLLPDAFGPADLGRDPDLMKTQKNGLSHASTDPMVQAALKAANASYAPYSKDFCGVALQTGDGSIHIGQYAENAAYNPSLLPMASALSQMNLSQPAQATLDIIGACLLEAEAPISQMPAAVNSLSVIAPDVEINHVVLTA